MSGLRQPVSAAQALLILLSAIAFAVAQHWAGTLTLLQLVPLLLLAEFVVQPVSTLIHELGHGIAARDLGATQASIMIGRGPWLRFSILGIRINFSFLPSRGVMVRGICHYNGANLPWRSRAVISLSGPLATSIELLACSALLPLLWPAAGPVTRNLITLTVIGLVVSLITNLAPIKVARSDTAVVVANDGARARQALRLHRQGVPVPAVRPRPPASGPGAGTSVPPPSVS